jgi:hypothetical protein
LILAVSGFGGRERLRLVLLTAACHRDPLP